MTTHSDVTLDSRARQEYALNVDLSQERGLTQPERRLVSAVLNNVPAAGLPPGSNVSSVGGLIYVTATLGDNLGKTMRAKQDVEAELKALKADVAAMRRLLLG